jgi:malate dehydrogenase (oxaloacetate-decarboxylating)(NADP+)
MSSKLKKQALEYHQHPKPGKIEVVPTKPTQTKKDLSLAYSPGVAEPCLEIAQNPEDAYKYTAKGNLVAVISNGSAVLGLGDIGALASKPVMEGKGVLFKIFADIDVFDIELNCDNVDDFCKTVKSMEPTFGGVNLEDIKAPECFEIEKRLKEELNIPIMHDDQHGTAIISGAALINALQIVNKKASDIKMVVNGAGASAISCAKIFISLGVKKSNLIMLDSKGVISKEREGLDRQKAFFATNRTEKTLDDAMKNADVFVGLSKGNILSKEMIKSMAKDPIVFAMANPDPEIEYNQAISIREDIIMATGRSDHPNQVNNVLGFPFIFRGALDVRATSINEAMKLAAVEAIAELAQEPVPELVNLAYNNRNLAFGKDYIIPKPLDPRLLTTVAPAVAKAAMDSGVAQEPIKDWKAYNNELLKRLGQDSKFIRRLIKRATQDPKKVVFAEADTYKVLRAAIESRDEGIALPILLGKKNKIEKIAEENGLDIGEIQVIDPRIEDAKREEFGKLYFEKRKRKGVTQYEAVKLMRERNYFGSMMVETGAADAFISGLTRNYPDTIRPCLEVIGKAEGVQKVAGMYVILSKRGPLFFADTTVNINPTAEELVSITLQAAEKVRQFNIEPKIALLSYSNFGSSKGDQPVTIQKAVSILHKEYPKLVIDGEMQANFALDGELRAENYPFSKLGSDQANVFIFPNLSSGNIAYKLAQSLAGSESIGPVLMGFKKSVHVLQLGSSIREIVNMVALSVVDAQFKD